MIQAQNNSIFILSEDITIIDSIKEAFNDDKLFFFSKDIPNIKRDDLVVVDGEKFDIKTISSDNIININSLKKPFSLSWLLKEMEKILLNKNRILKFKNFIIDNDTLLYNNVEVVFGNKEIALIRYLYNKPADKEELLEYIWGYGEEIETKVLENTINKIRQKFKSIGIGDFVIFENGKYKIII